MISQTMMTSQAKEKVQELANYPSFRQSFDNFINISSMYANTNQPAPGKDIFRKPYKHMIKKVRNAENVYLFRDKNNRFIFTIEKDDEGQDTAILIDVLTRQDVKVRLRNENRV